MASILTALLPVEHIILDLSVSSKKRFFEQVGLLIENKYGIGRHFVFDALFEREKLGSTGLGKRVALPHARIKDLKQTLCFFVRLLQPIPFDAPDGEPVQLLFVVLGSDKHPEKMLELWSFLAGKLANDSFRSELVTTHEPSVLHACFSKV